MDSVERRVDAVAWPQVEQELDRYGCAVLPRLLSPAECDALAAMYARDELFRSRVVMERHGLHQDLYGEHVFPLQLAILLSEPERDFTGGEFVMTEQRPRMQSRAEVVPLRQGDAVVFAVNTRPVQGSRGSYRVQLRHGVSRVRSGRRHTLGVIFHDAR